MFRPATLAVFVLVMTSCLIGSEVPERATTTPLPDLAAAGPVTIPYKPVPSPTTRVELDDSDLDGLGVDRYRFISTVTLPRGGITTARFRGQVQVEPAVTLMVAEGFSGEYQLYLTDETRWFRYPERTWRPLASNRPWNYLPGGPIPDYGTAGLIAELAIRSGAEPVGVEQIAGRDTNRMQLVVSDSLTVEAWVTTDGVVVRVRVVETTTHGPVVVEWRLHDINGGFDLPSAPPD